MAPLPMSQSLETVSVLGSMAKGTKITDGIKLAHQLILRWEDYTGLISWAQYNHKSPYKWKREAEEREPEGNQGEKELPEVDSFEGTEMGL